jgi:hypothetical protein
MKNINKLAILFLFIIGFASGNSAKAQMTEDKVQALYILSFLKYIEFPAAGTSYKIGYFGGNSTNFTDMASYLEARKSNGKAIEMAKVDMNSNLSDYNIIFIASDKTINFDQVSAKVQNNPVVIVTEKSDLVQQGASISFVKIGENIKFQLNESSFKQKNLKVSGSLISLAIVV